TKKHLITFQLQAKLRKRDLPQRSQSTLSFFIHTLHLCAQCLSREIPGNLLKPRKRFRIATLKHKEYFEGFPIPAHFILISTGERNLSCGKKRFVSEPPQNVKIYATGMKPLALRNSLTNASKPPGSSMQQAWPVLGRILWTAPGINDAVLFPAASELSYSPLMTSVGTFIEPRRGVMSVPPRARKIWAMDSPDSH